MSDPKVLALALGAFSLLAACTPPDSQYPVSGEVCGPEDPVMDVDAADLNCVPAT